MKYVLDIIYNMIREPCSEDNMSHQERLKFYNYYLPILIDRWGGRSMCHKMGIKVDNLEDIPNIEIIEEERVEG